MHKKPFQDCYWVEPGLLLAGQYPGAMNKEEARSKLRALLECGITAFVDLTVASENQLIPYDGLLGKEAANLGRSVRYMRMPIPDVQTGTTADVARILDIIEDCLITRQPVYVHCYGGHGRTGMVVGCFLGRQGMDGAAALERLRLLHAETSKPQYPSPETQEQKQMVMNWGPHPTPRDRIYGCLLGGALGDALGYPIEFAKLSEIRSQYGPGGLQDFSPFEVGLISDDTQMTLFTAEGLIRAAIRGWVKGICDIPAVVHHAYIRWLYTQGEKVAVPAKPGLYFDSKPDGWLATIADLHARRAPGMTCLAVLQHGAMGTISEPANDSKGCGGIMRIAPVGLVQGPDPFELGCALAAITHGHPSGYLAAGYFAQLIYDLRREIGLPAAIAHATAKLRERSKHEECLRAVERAVSLAEEGRPSPEKVESLGRGFVAEEALSISLYCAMVAEGFADGVRLAINHSGDSDSTGSMTGNILGTMLGRGAIPHSWLEKLELSEVIGQVAQDLSELFVPTEAPDPDPYRDRYPGW